MRDDGEMEWFDQLIAGLESQQNTVFCMETPYIHIVCFSDCPSLLTLAMAINLEVAYWGWTMLGKL